MYEVASTYIDRTSRINRSCLHARQEQKKSKPFSYDPKSTRNSQVKPFETVGTNASPAPKLCEF